MNISEKIQVKLHTMICKCCKGYTPDSKVMNEILHLLGEEDDTKSLSEEEKQELKNALLSLDK